MKKTSKGYYFNRINFRETKFHEVKNSRNFLDLISQMSSSKNFAWNSFREWNKSKEKNIDFQFINAFLRLKERKVSKKTARIKILGGFNFANERSQTFSRDLISRK